VGNVAAKVVLFGKIRLKIRFVLHNSLAKSAKPTVNLCHAGYFGCLSASNRSAKGFHPTIARLMNF
jgi:hypothetical protein